MSRLWRVVPLRAGGSLWWIIFRRGVRLWRKPDLAGAMAYIERQERFRKSPWGKGPDLS